MGNMRPNGENAYAWREFGADLAAVARVLAAEHGGRIALGLGHSFGDTSMLLAAAEEPALFERLVLVDPVLHEPRAAQSYDPERSARALGLVERASRRRVVFPDRAAARENWRDKELFADWDPRAFDLYLAEGMADRPDGQVESFLGDAVLGAAAICMSTSTIAPAPRGVPAMSASASRASVAASSRARRSR